MKYTFVTKFRKWTQEKELLLENKLVDKIYDALLKIPEFKSMGMDAQGEVSLMVEKIFKKYI